MATSSPKLSVLDATPIGPGMNASQALGWTTEVAHVCESLGFHRLWVVEHHGVADIGGCCPAVLLAHLAASTRTLRLGAGGVMLPNHSPLIIAEQFSTLQGLFPGRIDLGVGKATGAPPLIARALGSRPILNDDDLAERLDELSGFMTRRFPAGHDYEACHLALEVEPTPVYLLGTGIGSARTAARRGMPYAFAHHLNPDAGRQSLSTYRDEFRPSVQLDKPWSIVTVAVVCAESAADAQYAATSAAVVRVRRSLVMKHQLTIDDDVLLNAPWSKAEERIAERELAGGWIIVGDPDQVVDGISRLAESSGADEVMLTTIEYAGESRLRTLNAIAQSPRFDEARAA